MAAALFGKKGCRREMPFGVEAHLRRCPGHKIIYRTFAIRGKTPYIILQHPYYTNITKHNVNPDGSWMLRNTRRSTYR